ncbi:MAG: hypothetical protein PUF37_04445 [Prevotellaceae bacterium]|uniref:hypothetical protein n=1 Tax=Prevotella sp. AGR2160 TaxID=1280674 RepID=UPI000419EC1B|nr:hypothetical protein [Prevotella sp. AGR2160]MDD6552819.1 hypothetical protein [Prevotellaceae bacterium]
MKRITSIFAALFLSALIIVLSVGFVGIHCEHLGDLSLTQIQKLEHGHQDCAPMKKCMKVTVSKLSPTQVSTPSVFHFLVAQPLIAVLPALTSLPVLPRHPLDTFVSMRTPHAPPRAYLAFLRILRL